MNEALAELYKHNLWANLRLLDACAPLTDDQLDLNAPGTYGRVRDTLVHLFGAEQRYVARLMGREPEDTVSKKKGFPGFDVLREGAQRSGEALVGIAEQLDPELVLRYTWRGEPSEIPVPIIIPARILMIQAINHATEHRTHIVGILNQNGIETPDMDAWAYNDEMGK